MYQSFEELRKDYSGWTIAYIEYWSNEERRIWLRNGDKYTSVFVPVDVALLAQAWEVLK